MKTILLFILTTTIYCQAKSQLIVNDTLKFRESDNTDTIIFDNDSTAHINFYLDSFPAYCEINLVIKLKNTENFLIKEIAYVRGFATYSPNVLSAYQFLTLHFINEKAKNKVLLRPATSELPKKIRFIQSFIFYLLTDNKKICVPLSIWSIDY